MTGRVKTYEAIVKGHNVPTPGVPESFKVLVKELQSLCLDVKILGEDGEEVDLKDDDDDDSIYGAGGKALPDDEITMDDDLPNGKDVDADEAADAGFEIQDEDNVFGLLNDSYTIPDQTKAAIREIADRLGYRPNARAKNFARQASGTVLFITDFYQNIAFENPHMFEIISGIATYLDGKDYSLTLKPLTKQAAPLYIRDIIQQRQADALIIHAFVLSPELAAILSRVDFPYLVIGKPGFRCSICWIDVNHEQAGQIAANYLLDKGYRRPHDNFVYNDSTFGKEQQENNTFV